ncbi:MAG: cbb3-type cytochrome c oxidase subunit I, partial [Halobacteriaceae archaeon]
LLFIIGGITGVFLGAVVLDYEFRGTYWVVAHFHYVMVGGVTALVGGVYYWFPKITGKMYDEYLGRVHFALYFIGFNLLYFPMFLAWQTPRRVFVYPEVFETWHRIATVGAFILGISFLVMFYNLYRSFTSGEDAPSNPWKYSRTAEWAIPSPPPLENFPGVPSYEGGELSFEKEEEHVADGGTVTADEHVESHASYWPAVISLAGFLLLLGMSGIRQGSFVPGLRGTFYKVLTIGGGVLLLWSLIRLAGERFEGPKGGYGATWPFSDIENTKLGVWIFLASDVVLFGAFIGSYLFTRVANGWQDWHHLIPEAHTALPGLINTYLLLTSSFTVVLALVAAEKRSRKGVMASMSATILLGVGFLINKALEWNHLRLLDHGEFAGGWWLSTNIASSTFYLTTGLHGAHVLVGLIIASYMLVRAYHGAYLDDDRPLEYFGLYWHFVDIVWLFLFPLFYIV